MHLCKGMAVVRLRGNIAHGKREELVAQASSRRLQVSLAWLGLASHEQGLLRGMLCHSALISLLRTGNALPWLGHKTGPFAGERPPRVPQTHLHLLTMAEERKYRALVCSHLGNPTDTSSHAPLKVLQQAAAPNLQPNSVRIKITAAGLNFADALQVQGQYQE